LFNICIVVGWDEGVAKVIKHKIVVLVSTYICVEASGEKPLILVFVNYRSVSSTTDI